MNKQLAYLVAFTGGHSGQNKSARMEVINRHQNIELPTVKSDQALYLLFPNNEDDFLGETAAISIGHSNVKIVKISTTV